MENLIVYAITMMTMGQILFCLPNVILGLKNKPTHTPLLIFFIANAIIASGPAIWLLRAEYSIFYIAAIFPAWMLMAPSFWLYVDGLTSHTPWRLGKKHWHHFVPFLLTTLLSVMILTLPSAQQTALFFEEQDVTEGRALFVAIWLFLTMIFWLGQSSYYVYRTVKRLSAYHKQLRDLFANNDKQELHWIKLVLFVICLTWLLAVGNLLSTLLTGAEAFGYQLGSLLMFVIIWTLGHWGLKQKPGFAGRYPDQTTLESLVSEELSIPRQLSTEKTPEPDKYQKSALSREQAERLATKIRKAMESDQLFLDPDLSLSKLATHIVVSPNYLSQTLNETMNTTFYDFVNGWRIQAAIPKILANKDSVLTIALEVGFNARSSFYNVFKKETGLTPTQYRKQHV